MICARARHVDAEKLFRRQAEGMLLIDRRDVVEPIEIRDRLQIGLLLDQLFGAAVKQADMRIDALHDLAVEFEHQPQHAVRRRMLRPEVDGEVRWWRRLPSGQLRHFRGLRREPRIEFVPGDDEAVMPAFADQIDAVVCLHFERDALADDLRAFDIDGDGLARATSPRDG